jgi:hypothetical protein
VTPLSILGRLLVGSIMLLIIPVMAAVLGIAVCVSGLIQTINYIAGGKI